MIRKLFCMGDEGRLYFPLQYIFNIGALLSQILATIVFAQDPDETFSSCCGKARVFGGPSWVKESAYNFVNWLFQDPFHCLDAIEIDEGHRRVIELYYLPTNCSEIELTEMVLEAYKHVQKPRRIR